HEIGEWHRRGRAREELLGPEYLFAALGERGLEGVQRPAAREVARQSAKQLGKDDGAAVWLFGVHLFVRGGGEERRIERQLLRPFLSNRVLRRTTGPLGFEDGRDFVRRHRVVDRRERQPVSQELQVQVALLGAAAEQDIADEPTELVERVRWPIDVRRDLTGEHVVAAAMEPKG